MSADDNPDPWPDEADLPAVPPVETVWLPGDGPVCTCDPTDAFGYLQHQPHCGTEPPESPAPAPTATPATPADPRASEGACEAVGGVDLTEVGEAELIMAIRKAARVEGIDWIGELGMHALADLMREWHRLAGDALTARHVAEVEALRAELADVRASVIELTPLGNSEPVRVSFKTCAPLSDEEYEAFAEALRECRGPTVILPSRDIRDDELAAAEQRGREQAAQAIEALPTALDDRGWAEIAWRAENAGWDPEDVRAYQRDVDDFATLTIGCAYQVTRDRAASAARGSTPTPAGGEAERPERSDRDPDRADVLMEARYAILAEVSEQRGTSWDSLHHAAEIVYRLYVREIAARPPRRNAAGLMVSVYPKKAGGDTVALYDDPDDVPAPVPPAEEPAPAELPSYMAISGPNRTGQYSLRCWGDGTCEGWLWLDIGSREYALAKANRHVGSHHLEDDPAPAPTSGEGESDGV